MSERSFVFTSESVTEGHPDKICDQISDAVLDECFRQDKYSRVACETVTTTGLVFVTGEITTKARLDIPALVRRVIGEIGYTDPAYGLSARDCGIISALNRQSPDIAMGVDEGKDKEMGAGDQGHMFGFAIDETESLMPLPIMLAHGLTRRLAEVRKNKKVPWLRPDGKSQVSVKYEDGKPKEVVNVVLAAQHDDDVSQETIRDTLKKEIIEPVCGNYLSHSTKYYINATGRFVIGGPMGDAGLTGRKIIADTYGGYARHGGGAFSGKDPTKVDRSAAYFARWVAKNIVASGYAKKCEIQVSYSIGVAHPISLLINTFGTGKMPDEDLEKKVMQRVSFKPKDMIERLDLLRPIYQKTAAYGHFGRNDPDFSWEKVKLDLF
ncbi:MAG: methionine adenosyltransferase [Thermoplasmata archaeon]